MVAKGTVAKGTVVKSTIHATRAGLCYSLYGKETSVNKVMV